MKVIKTFTHKFNFEISESERKQCLQAINKYITGDEEVNVWNGKCYVTKYPDKDHELQLACRNIMYGRRFEIKMDLMEDGSIEMHK